jgi:hypothetical protein
MRGECDAVHIAALHAAARWVLLREALMRKQLHRHFEKVSRRLALAGAFCMMLPPWATSGR